MELSWQQKAKAIQVLTGWPNFSLKMRDIGSWYVEHRFIERKEDGVLSSGCQNEPTPAEAVDSCWEWMTDPKYYLIVRAQFVERRAVKWNGFMWEDVSEEME